MFYITVSNGLLKDDHEQRMGAAVWQYMWLLDKITKIDDEGYGWVLGGKPIKLSDIAEKKTEVTVSRNLKRLAKEGYIVVKRTPYGLIIKVSKAKKSFNKNDKSEGERFNKNDKRDLTRMINPDNKNVKSNKTITVDNINKTYLAAKPQDPVNSFISLFEPINPGINYGNTTNRNAADWLIKKYGFKKASETAKYAVSVHGKDYAPTITTPYQLKENLGKLIAYYKRENNKKSNVIII